MLSVHRTWTLQRMLEASLRAWHRKRNGPIFMFHPILESRASPLDPVETAHALVHCILHRRQHALSRVTLAEIGCALSRVGADCVTLHDVMDAALRRQGVPRHIMCSFIQDITSLWNLPPYIFHIHPTINVSRILEDVVRRHSRTGAPQHLRTLFTFLSEQGLPSQDLPKWLTALSRMDCPQVLEDMWLAFARVDDFDAGDIVRTCRACKWQNALRWWVSLAESVAGVIGVVVE